MGAVTPGIHLRWLPGAKREFPCRERTMQIARRSGNRVTLADFGVSGDWIASIGGEWMASVLVPRTTRSESDAVARRQSLKGISILALGSHRRWIPRVPAPPKVQS